MELETGRHHSNAPGPGLRVERQGQRGHRAGGADVPAGAHLSVLGLTPAVSPVPSGAGARPLVVVVGLGPAGADLVPEATYGALAGATRSFVRTRRHPAVEAAAAVAPGGFESFDRLYDSATTILQIADSTNVPITNVNAFASATYWSETYAKNVGMIYRHTEMWEYQPPTPDGSQSGYKIGFALTMSVVDHN